MLIVVIPYHHNENAIALLHAINQKVDAIELRLDYARFLDKTELTQLRQHLNLPVIFTLRKSSQGGYYDGDEMQRLRDIEELCHLYPDYLDLEYDIPMEFVRKIHQQFPHIKLICSYHNLETTPENLHDVLPLMQDACFDSYKMATYARSSLDALRMMKFVLDHHTRYPLTGLCMGEYGECTRILGPVVGSMMSYACCDELNRTALGQITIHELYSIYHIQKLNRDTKIYALLGDPVWQSAGHLIHNQAIDMLDANAVYIKMRVTQSEIKIALALCRDLPFVGFSITMPLKERVVPLLEHMDPASQEIKAINTIQIKNNIMQGCNTDGIAVIKVLKKQLDLKGKRVAVLGAGGAARAITYELLRHGVHVSLYNRNIDKATQLASELGCKAYRLSDFHLLKSEQYHVLINTLPVHVAFYPNQFPQIVMDIVYQSRVTELLSRAKQANYVCIYGDEMYIQQALLQFKYWFNPSENQLNMIEEMMKKYFIGV